MSKYIQEMAEKKYPLTFNPLLKEDIGFENLQQCRRQEFYTAGAQDMKEHIGGFAEWCEDNYTKVYSDELKKSAWVNVREETVLAHGSDYHYTTLIKESGRTTDQLVEKYFEQLNPQP